MSHKTKTRRPRTEMQFRVGAVHYKLTITPGALVHEGTPVNGCTMQWGYEILIAGDVQPCHRLAVLGHELARAWSFELGPGHDPENWFDIASTTARSLFDDLLRQGGEAALIAMRSRKPVKQSPALPSPARRVA